MNVIYFSGSGNTRRCAELFAGATGGKAVSIESCQEASQTITAAAELALAYPTHYSDVPKIVKDFVAQNGALFKGKKIFVIVTMGLFSGDGAGVGARLLKKQGAKILGGLHLRMPDAIGDVPMLKKPMAKNLATIKQTEQKIARAVESSKNGRYPKDGLYFWNHLAGLFGQRLWFIPTVKALRSKLKIDASKCSGCGVCAAGCPTKSIAMQNGKAVFAPGSCTLCYRCVNHCPARAITLIGKRVLEQCRYDIYEKAMKEAR
jgi:NAD-dependent dihydropyrimidine dehydrogenase PreA subunit/flavodoxin